MASTVLISSHDLMELESFASHVGYLVHWKLCFSEEMSSLTERFREVEVICEAQPVLPSEWPEAWMCPHTSAAVLRFIESRFDGEKTAAEIRRRFPDARNVSFTPMSLRAIFVAFAKTANEAA
jgi:ABC-2 type transport system ATP-binding protein